MPACAGLWMCWTRALSLPRCCTRGACISPCSQYACAEPSMRSLSCKVGHLRRSKESLNVLANNATFRLIEGVLDLGVNLREVCAEGLPRQVPR